MIRSRGLLLNLYCAGVDQVHIDLVILFRGPGLIAERCQAWQHEPGRVPA